MTEERVKCKRCDGSGYDPDNEFTYWDYENQTPIACYDCRGSGNELTIEDHIEEMDRFDRQNR